MRLNEILNEVKVQSSWIKDLTLDGRDVTLTTKIGRVYLIKDISKSDIKAWGNSPSLGQYYNEHIRDDYDVVRIK